jgi:hypothetical protein
MQTGVDIRDRFNKDVELLQDPLKVGDRVLSNGDLCELTHIGDDLIPQDPHVGTTCVVIFRAGETTQEYKYSTMFDNATFPGSMTCV